MVTGTGTGVGKTVVTAAIAACARQHGTRVAVVKPVQTGVQLAEPGDLARVSRPEFQIALVALVGVLLLGILKGVLLAAMALLTMAHALIVSINGEKVTDNDALYKILDKHQIGDTVNVEIIRRGRRMTVPVRLTETPPARRRGFGE